MMTVILLLENQEFPCIYFLLEALSGQSQCLRLKGTGTISKFCLCLNLISQWHDFKRNNPYICTENVFLTFLFNIFDTV